MDASTVPSPRPPAVAGYFYPGSARTLTAELERMFQDTPPATVTGTIYGLIAPHAGYVYSGKVAASAYKAISKKTFEIVAVIAPSHRDPFSGVTVYPGDYATPMGVVHVDQTLVESLSATHAFIKKSALGHRDEHALEVQLPFLQYWLKSFHLLPLVMGAQDWDTCVRLGEALGTELQGRKALIVASSDLSHYFNQTEAKKLDNCAMEAIRQFDGRALYDAVVSGKCEACGAGPIIATMIAAEKLGARRAQIIEYRTSGDISGDYDQVVGYLAAALTD